MWILTLWMTFYGVNVSDTIQVQFDTKDKCLTALKSLRDTNSDIVTISALCTQGEK